MAAPSAHTPTKRRPSPPGQAIDSPARPGQGAELAPRDQQPQQQPAYQSGSPIRFYDDEVKRMHNELDKRSNDDRVAARRAIRTASRRRKTGGVTIKGFFVRVLLFYLAIAYFLVCPNDTKRDRAVCRSIDSVSLRLKGYEPLVRPYYQRAQRQISPYVAKVQQYSQPYVDKVRPHYQRVDRLARPHLATVRKGYEKQVHPRLVGGVQRSQAFTKPYVAKLKKQYTKTLAPSVEWYAEAFKEWWAAKIESHLSRATSIVRAHSQTAYNTVSPAYYKGVPLAQHHYRQHLLPFSRKAYSNSRRTYVSHVHPRALTVGRYSAAFYRSKVLPALHRFWSRFVDPQLDKIRERIFEYRAKKARIEALERVEKKTQEVVQQHEGEDAIEDFIRDLRDTKVPSHAGPDGLESPAIPEDAPPAYSASTPPPPLSPQEAAAVVAEKRRALEALQATYEQEIATLGQAEQALLVDRLAEIRSHALSDIPARFDASLESLDEEGDKMVGRLGKYFDRVAADKKLSTEEKVKDADFLGEKAKGKVRKMAEKVKSEAEAYRVELEGKEEVAVEKAQQAVSALVAQAQSELGVGWTWLEDVAPRDWQRYHSLRKAEQNLHTSFNNLRAGAIKDVALVSLKPYKLLDSYAKRPDELVNAFEKILEKIKIKGQRELKGDWLGVVPEAQKAYDSVSGKFGAVVADLKESASSVAGIEKKPTNVAQSVSSLAKVAQISASSVAAEAMSALPTIEAHQEYLAAARQAYGDASQNVLRAVGVEPSPTNLQQTASSLARAASASAAQAYAEASQSALRAVGREPSPTDLAQSLASVRNIASAQAASAYSQVLSDYPSSISSALAAATQSVDQVAEQALSSAADLASSAASVVSSLAAPAASMLNPAPVAAVLEGAMEKANEYFGDVSQGALSALGVEPSPTDFVQSASSATKAAGATLSSVLSQASSLAAPHPDYTRSLRSSASAASTGLASSLSSLSSAASQNVHDTTRTTPEGVFETASAIASSLSSLAQPHSAYETLHVVASAASATDVAKSQLSNLAASAQSLGQPHPSYAKSEGAASLLSATDAAKSAVTSLASKASQAVHDATRTTPEGVKETVQSIVGKVEELAKPHEKYGTSQMAAKVAEATEKVKSVVHGEL
ncbi:hypothetical protein JCM11641_007848 [Rhodosporidiobolus odoratus]